MTQQTFIKAEKFAEWEAMGEDAVRTKYNLGHFGDVGHKRALAKMWLDAKDQERIDASNSAALRISRSAKNAAWFAGIIALVALMISGLSLYLSTTKS